ncbi:MAG: DUF3592 domain-containing protein [Terracidiphilus sp.]
MEEEAVGRDSKKLTYPSELSGPLPRRVQLNSTEASFLVVVVVVCLGLGSMAVGFDIVSTLRQMQQRTALRRNGNETVGNVTATHGGHGDSTVSYTFTANGSHYLGKAKMPNYRLILHESDQILVRYLPSNPAVNHPAAWEWSGQSDLIPKAFALFFVVVGSVALVALVRDRKLAREGKPVEGIVIDCSPGKAEFRVKYEFRTDDGVPIMGLCNCTEEYEKGANIWILYLPWRPRRNHSYPMEFFSVAE